MPGQSISFVAAFAAGVLSFLSPCVLPLVPGYISYMSGRSLEDLMRDHTSAAARWKTGVDSISFVLGFSLVFTLLGASASAVGRLLNVYLSVFAKIAGTLIILFGLHTMGVIRIPLLYYEKRASVGGFSPGLVGSFLMGTAFAFGWTPCIGPILAGILALAAKQGTVALGMLLLFTYSLGLGIPFILTGFGTAVFVQFFQRYRRFIRLGEVSAGILLVGVGALIFFNRLTWLNQWTPRWLLRFAW